MATEDNGHKPKKEQPARVSFLDRAIQQAIGDNRVLGRDNDPAKELYPELWRWLTVIDCPGNRVRQPASLTIRAGPEGILATINDRDLGCSIDAACGHLGDVLAAVERALTCENPNIRISSKKDPHVRRRKTQS